MGRTYTLPRYLSGQNKTILSVIISSVDPIIHPCSACHHHRPLGVDSSWDILQNKSINIPPLAIHLASQHQRWTRMSISPWTTVDCFVIDIYRGMFSVPKYCHKYLCPLFVAWVEIKTRIISWKRRLLFFLVCRPLLVLWLDSLLCVIDTCHLFIGINCR